MRPAVLDEVDGVNQVVISVNPKAGRRSSAPRVARLVAALQSRGLTPRVMTDLSEVAECANRLFSEGRLRALVGVGGDGTAAELVNRTQPGVPVTLLAAGTANLLAKYLRLGRSPERLAQTIADGETLTFDAGRASGRLFLVMVSCGFDAEVVHRVHARRLANPKGAHISYFSYLKPIFDAMRSYRYPSMSIRDDVDRASSVIASNSSADASPVLARARWVFAFNLPQYGWGLPLAPKAVGTDGILDICAFSGASLFHGFKYVAAAQCGSLHRFLPDCDMLRSEGFWIESDEPVPYQLDGDPGGMLPVRIEVLPNRLTVLVPRWMKGRLHKRAGG